MIKSLAASFTIIFLKYLPNLVPSFIPQEHLLLKKWMLELGKNDLSNKIHISQRLFILYQSLRLLKTIIKINFLKQL